MKQVIVTLLVLAAAQVQAQEWKSDLHEAFREANVKNKNVLLFFSVSDACDLCRRLDNVVFQSDEFRQYAAENLVLVKLDFRNSVASGNKADQLLIVEKYNKDGFFPWVVLLNDNEKIVGKLPIYNDQTARQYVEQLRTANK